MPLKVDSLPSALRTPPNRQSGERRVRAYREIKSALISGKYRPGDDLTVERIASELAVSRQPVMEAMRILAQEGFVEIIPQVGCRVAVHSESDIEDFFRLFANVESLTASLAAERRTDEELQHLHEVSGQLGKFKRVKHTEHERADAYRVLNRAFHGLIHSMARAPLISEFSRSLWDRSDFHLSGSSQRLLFSERFNVGHHDHEAILLALEHKNPTAAGQLMSDHILGFRIRLLETLTRPTAG